MFPLLFSFFFLPVFAGGDAPVEKAELKTLAVHEFSLENRYNNPSVNDIFKENILLTVHYATGDSITAKNVQWDKVTSNYRGTLTLDPGQTFAFHDDVLPEFRGKIHKTTNVHFALQEGFKSDGYLAGDGVCHLASILYWTAKDAALETSAPTRHDFAAIPDVPEEFGVSIYNDNLSQNETNELQNLYIKNNKDKTIIFEFEYNGKTLTVKAEEKI